MGIILFFVQCNNVRTVYTLVYISLGFIPIFLTWCFVSFDVYHTNTNWSVQWKFGVTNIWLFWPTQPTLVFCLFGDLVRSALTSQISDLVRGDAKPITSWEVMIILSIVLILIMVRFWPHSLLGLNADRWLWLMMIDANWWWLMMSDTTEWL